MNWPAILRGALNAWKAIQRYRKARGPAAKPLKLVSHSYPPPVDVDLRDLDMDRSPEEVAKDAAEIRRIAERRRK